MTSMKDVRKQGRDRAVEALALRREGLTFAQIGERLGGVSIERARQLVAKGERIERHPEHFR